MPEEDQGRWEKFVTESLAEINEKNSRELGGHNPMHFSSDDDADTDYSTIPFAGGSAQQVYANLNELFALFARNSSSMLQLRSVVHQVVIIFLSILLLILRFCNSTYLIQDKIQFSINAYFL